MPNIAKLLKDEIQRIARKEIKASASELAKKNVALKKTVADLRKELAGMKREIRQLTKSQGQPQQAEPQETAEAAAEKFRISAKGIRSLRSKLQLSQADFAKLAGVSMLAVYQWEKKEGTLNLRQATKAKLAEIRGIGKREAMKRLEEMPEKKPAAKAKKKRSKTVSKKDGRRKTNA